MEIFLYSPGTNRLDMQPEAVYRKVPRRLHLLAPGQSECVAGSNVARFQKSYGFTEPQGLVSRRVERLLKTWRGKDLVERDRGKCGLPGCRRYWK
jgi:hypothetical protein